MDGSGQTLYIPDPQRPAGVLAKLVSHNSRFERSYGQRGLVRGFSCRFFNAIDMKPAVTSFRRCGGAPQNPNVNYINFEPL